MINCWTVLFWKQHWCSNYWQHFTHLYLTIWLRALPLPTLSQSLSLHSSWGQPLLCKSCWNSTFCTSCLFIFFFYRARRDATSRSRRGVSQIGSESVLGFTQEMANISNIVGRFLICIYKFYHHGFANHALSYENTDYWVDYWLCSLLYRILDCELFGRSRYNLVVLCNCSHRRLCILTGASYLIVGNIPDLLKTVGIYVCSCLCGIVLHLLVSRCPLHPCITWNSLKQLSIVFIFQGGTARCVLLRSQREPV